MRLLTVVWKQKENAEIYEFKILKEDVFGADKTTQLMLNNLYLRVYPYIRTVCMQKCRQFCLKFDEDIIQDVIMLMLTSLLKFNPAKSTFKTFINMRIHNWFYDRVNIPCRMENRGLRVEADSEWLDDIAVNIIDPTTEVETND